MARKGENNYFLMMKEMAVCAHEASIMLKDILMNFDPDKLDDMMHEMHHIEHKGDNMKHQVMEKLIREFITPIEREDIMALVDQTDDLIDSVEDVVLKLYMYNIKSIRPEALEFAEAVCQCTRELIIVFEEFSDYKKSKKLHDSIVEINRLEEVGDSLYVNAVRGLYVSGVDTISAVSWGEIYACFENCCDTCEHVANLVENVIMKNT